MKDKILEDIINWYENKEGKPDIYMEDFIEIIIDKTARAIFDEIKEELKNEFDHGNLKHSFIISDEYYLYLKIKDIKNKLIKSSKDEDYIEKEETNNENEEKNK